MFNVNNSTRFEKAKDFTTVAIGKHSFSKNNSAHCFLKNVDVFMLNNCCSQNLAKLGICRQCSAIYFFRLPSVITELLDVDGRMDVQLSRT